jgi:Predicted AAA-ATPase
LLADEYDACANEYRINGEPFSVLKAFWSTIKAGCKLSYGIQKEYITGVIPLLLSDLISGADDQENISFIPQMSTICGLTRSGVLGALRVICNDEKEVQKHLKELAHNANGYHFCQQRKVEPVFNTQTALSYLQVSKEKHHLVSAARSSRGIDL